MPRISVIMPAFRAEASIARAVASVVGSHFPDWELVISADDGANYESVLGEVGIADGRIRFISTGGIGSGSSSARNAALAVASAPLAAMLDADDRYHAEKLGRLVAALALAPVASTAIAVTDGAGRLLRTVGEGADRMLEPGRYKWTNLSMDSMLGWDRRIGDPRFDPTLRAMTDFDFLLRLLATADRVAHLGEPLHDYIKMPLSVSNGPGVGQRMIGAKTTIRQRLADGYYPLAAEEAREGLLLFLDTTIAAEARYEAALGERPGLLFEDHLEPLLIAASTSAP